MCDLAISPPMIIQQLRPLEVLLPANCNQLNSFATAAGKGGMRRYGTVRRLWSALLLLLLLSACRPGCLLQRHAGSEHLAVVSWNVENLFDGKRDGSEYDQFDPGSGDWDAARYHTRLREIAEAVNAMEPLPDILCLQEIEHEDILEELVTAYLGRAGLQYFIATHTEGSAIEVGLISRYPITDVSVHAVSCEAPFALRPVLECTVDTGIGKLVIYVNHWKSKRDGEAESEPARLAAAGLVRQLIARRTAESPGTLLLVAGDLNESADEFRRVNTAYATALREAEQGVVSEGLLISGELADVSGSLLYDPWLDPAWASGEDAGSYCYRGEWLTLDHILCNAAAQDGIGWEFSAFTVFSGLPFANERGYPASWDSRSGVGSSDHFPVCMEFTALPWDSSRD